MTSIDLIPLFWRDRHRIRRALRHFALALVGLVLCLGALKGLLIWKTQQTMQQMEQMEQDKQNLDLALDQNQRNFKRLEELRGKTARMKHNQSISIVEGVLNPLDNALVEGVTLGALSIQLLESSPGKSTDVARVSLEGESAGAAGLTQFTENLMKIPGWKNLKISRMTPRADGGGLEFSIEADANVVGLVRKVGAAG